MLIRKTGAPKDPPPRLADYAASRDSFSWDALAADMGASVDGPLNLADLALRGGGSLVCIGAGGRETPLDSAALESLSGRFANLLRSADVLPGDRVVLMLRPIPELFGAVLGALRAGAVAVPMGRVRNADAVRNLLERTGAKAAVLEADTRALVSRLRPALPALRTVVVRDEKAGEGERTWDEAVGSQTPGFAGELLPAPTPAFLNYTDLGMTGAVRPHGVALALAASARSALDLGPGDGLVTLAVPGDPLFVPYVLLAPLLAGATSYVFEDPVRYGNYAKFPHRVDVWYSAVRAIDVILRGDPGLGTLLSRCRHLAVSHPYDPGFVSMTELSYGSPLHPTWYPRELGVIQTACLRAEDIAVGSIGRPLPGVELRVEKGELDVRLGPGSPFGGYWNDPDATAERVREGWFCTGKKAKMDPDGTVWLQS